MATATKKMELAIIPRAVRSSADLAHLGFAENKSDASRGTLFIGFINGRKFYVANVARFEFDRLVALAEAMMIRASDVRAMLDADAVVMVAPKGKNPEASPRKWSRKIW